jgi:8-oxo-dGTP pyrophosphatase MutT (NUDIX family)
MRTLAVIDLEGSTETEISTYVTREAARGIVIDAEGLIALMHAGKDGYYKLPGGGIEQGEDPRNAMVRECKEEIGCDVEITAELGIIVEHRKEAAFKQTSYGFACRVIGNKGEAVLTETELEAGFKAVWVSIEEARKLLSDPLMTKTHTYMSKRDSKFLETALLK